MTSQRKKIVIAVAGGLLLVVAIVGLAELARLTVFAIAGLIAFGVVVFLIFRVWAKRKTKTIFGFYVAANDVLTDVDGSRYHFEVADVIRRGERVVRSMPDAPPLCRFALGALHFSVNDYNAAAEHLALAAEEEVLKDSQLVLPSRPLRRYVKRLRQIEKRPRLHAKINAAIASLEMMHRERGARLLAESQEQLTRMVEAYEREVSEQNRTRRPQFSISTGSSLKSVAVQPTISEVLNDIYQEEPEAS